MKIKNLTLTLCGALLLGAPLTSGCGGDDGSSPPPQTLSGMLLLPGEMSAGGITVQARQADGSPFDSTVTSPAGWYQLRGDFDGRVEARLPDGTLLASEVRQASSGNVNISYVTTIMSRYANSSQQLPLTEIETRVRASLAVPLDIELGHDLGDSWRSFFSATAFTQAAGNTPLDTFIDEAVARARDGGVQAFRVPHPYPTLFRSLHPREAEYYGIENATPAGADELGAVAGTTSGSVFTSVLSGIAKNALSVGGKAAAGWACQQIGVGQAATEAAEYDALITELQLLQQQVNGLQVADIIQSEIDGADPYVTNLLSKFKTFNTYLKQNTAGGATQAANLLDSYVNPDNGAQVVTDINGVLGYLLGTQGGVSPLGPLYASTIVESTFGSTNPSPSFMFMDVRSNAALDVVATLVDYYLGAVQVGAIMEAEYAHLDTNTFNTVFTSDNTNTFASNLLAAQTSVNSVAAELTEAMQYNAPSTIGSDSVISFPIDNLGTSGYLIYTPIQGPTTFDNAVNNSLGFSVGPWGAGNWTIAPQFILTALRSYAFNLGNGDVNMGLFKMGIIASYTTDNIIIFSDSKNFALYDITKDNYPTGRAKNSYNYLLLHSTPGPSEDPGTLLATLYPSSMSISGGSVTSPAFEALTSLAVYKASTQYSPVPGPTYVDISATATWSSSDASQATVANYAAVSGDNGSGNGVVTFHQPNATATVTAQLCTELSGSPGQVGGVRCQTYAPSSNFPVSGPAQPSTLTSILVSPFQQNYATTSGDGTLAVDCYATGFYSDDTVKDLTDLVTWRLTSEKNKAAFNTGVPNQLDLYSEQGTDSITITATYDGVQGQGFVTTSFP